MDSIVINDFDDSEIGIWELIEDQFPDVYEQIDSEDIFDIIKIE
jgi:hypothetical protein